MNDEEIEMLIQRQKLASLPAEWREEILSEAASDIRERQGGEGGDSFWHDLFWPSPKAWGALAGIWILIALGHGVGMDGFQGASATARHRQEPAALERARAQQRELMSELAGGFPADSSNEPVTPIDRSRSDRQTGVSRA